MINSKECIRIKMALLIMILAIVIMLIRYFTYREILEWQRRTNEALDLVGRCTDALERCVNLQGQ